MNNRPMWTLPEKSVCLWISDDVTADPADRENLAQAWKRLFEEIDIPAPTANWNSGDDYYRLLPTGHVLRESLWGISEIRLIRQVDQVRLFCQHDWKIVGSRIPDLAVRGSATPESVILGSPAPEPATRGSQIFGPVILGSQAIDPAIQRSQVQESQALRKVSPDPMIIEVMYACEACSSWTYHRVKFVGYQRESLEHRLGEILDEIVDNGDG